MQNNMANLIEQLKLMYLMNFKEISNFNNFFILICIFITTFIINNDEIYSKIEIKLANIFHKFKNFKKKTIILEGKQCFRINNYSSKIDNIFSDKFEAFWFYICSNNLDNKEIFSIKEYAENHFDDELSIESNEKIRDKHKVHYIIDQPIPFLIEKDIYCLVTKTKSSSDEKRKIEVENIIIEIYSYKLSLYELHKFLENLDEQFKKALAQKRNEKKFIYTLMTSSNNNREEEFRGRWAKPICWEECEFKSSRNFSNLFFEDKHKLLKKLNFFSENEDWYNYEGHPYTLGIGLYGPPGTGKTSVIKCIANKLNRHIIIIPLNKVKTQTDFNNYFFEKLYSRQNYKEIDWKDKIIVFEDIDCMSQIVKKRKLTKNKTIIDEINSEKSSSDFEFDSNLEKNLEVQNKLLNKIAKKVDQEHDDVCCIDFRKDKDDEITLSYILNIIDGIRETPGRIMIITSNDYESLDPALIRPGRIDITLEMKNASVDIIKEMYSHYYKDIIPEDIENNLKDYKISPAKIVNLRLENENKNDFLNALTKTF